MEEEGELFFSWLCSKVVMAVLLDWPLDKKIVSGRGLSALVGFINPMLFSPGGSISPFLSFPFIS